MFLKSFLAPFVCAMGAVGAPLRISFVPTIGPGYSAQEVGQIQIAMGDAFALANYAIHHFHESVFLKYFHSSDRQKVVGVFKNVLTSPNLVNITIVGDSLDENGVLRCTTGIDGIERKAYLKSGDMDKPKMTLCPQGFAMGVFDLRREKHPSTCDLLGPWVALEWQSLGSALLHEYMHFGALVTPPLGIRPIDHQYGPWNVTAMDKSLAIQNADSFAWFAEENYWTSFCGRKFGYPIDDGWRGPGWEM